MLLLMKPMELMGHGGVAPSGRGGVAPSESIDLLLLEFDKTAAPMTKRPPSLLLILVLVLLQLAPSILILKNT